MSGKDYPSHIEVDPDLVDLIPDFLDDCRADMRQARAALARGDLAAARDIGHGYKGAGASYGFDAVTDWGAALESAAASGDSEAAIRAVLQMESYLAKVVVLDAAGQTVRPARQTSG